MLLLSTFHPRTGAPLTNTEDIIALLQRPRDALFSRDAATVHLACLAEATCVTHRRHPHLPDLAEAVEKRVAPHSPRISRTPAQISPEGGQEPDQGRHRRAHPAACWRRHAALRPPHSACHAEDTAAAAAAVRATEGAMH